jgi:hypothetical protein
MFSRKSLFRIASILLAVLLMSGMASARLLNLSIPGTGFTYQGRLTDGGAPANGSYDFEFKLYDALSGGSPVGGTVSKANVTVTDGLFTVLLDFGDVFDGSARYLGVGVRLGGSGGAYTPLDPRIALTPTPYALYAAQVPWSGITGRPDNVLEVAKSGGDFTSIQAALDSITTASDSNRFLVRVAPGVYTGRVTMKDYVDIEGSGELTTKITFTGSASSNTGTLLGADNAELRFLTVENSGGDAYAFAIYNASAAPRLTHITANATGGTDNRAVVNTASSTPEMKDVTASASGGTSNTGVNNDNSSPLMERVTASGSGGTNNFGVDNLNSSPIMKDMSATASGGTNNSGVHNHYFAPTMTNVTASASAGINNWAVYNESSNAVMNNVTANANSFSGSSYNWAVYNKESAVVMTNVSASAWGSYDNRGVYNEGSVGIQKATLTDVTASASGGANNYGVVNTSSSPIITNLTATGSGGNNNFGMENSSAAPTIINSVLKGYNNDVGTHYNYGLYNYSVSGTYTIDVNNSRFIGSTNSIYNAPGFTMRIGASRISGPTLAGGGVLTCAGVYNDSYTFFASTCP